MYDASGSRGGGEGRRGGPGAALEAVVLETRCQRCRSLIFAERIDPSALLPVVDETAQIICASCSTTEGRAYTH